MKVLLLFLLGTLNMFNTSIQSVNLPDQTRPQLIQFNTELIELGDVKKGEVKNFEFEFTNVSKEDLEIEFMSSCDCTTLDYPMSPVKPGEKGVIKVSFDSTEKTESETVDIDIDLVNKDEKGNPIFIRINYSFVLVK